MTSDFWASPKGSAVIVGSMCSASFFAGGILSYLLTKRTLELKYEQIIADEIAEAKAFYSKLNKKEEFADPTRLASPYQEVVETLGYGNVNTGPLAEEGERFMERITSELDEESESDDDDDDAFDYKTEVPNRSKDAPYIIHHDEFFENDGEFTQLSVTYFEEDDILVDEKDSPIPDVDGTVGQENLSHFGKGSKDNNIVYVRNERLELDFEVVRNKGNYAKDVLGFIEHSEKIGRPRKFRRDYE